MANIIAIIRKEAEKGNTLMDKKGNLINPAKLENTLRKSYLAGLKNGSVSFETSFADYQAESIKASFVDTSKINVLEIVLNDEGEMPFMPEPQETVAQ